MLNRMESMALAKRALAHYENGTTDQAPDILKVSVSDYLDADLWQAEIDTILKCVPLVLALSIELPATGDFKAMDAMGVPVLMVRGKDGVVRAFLNSCRHRGAQVCQVGSGNRQRFRCPYHAWVYDDRGALISPYRPDTFGDIDRSAYGLRELPTEERYGFIWVCLTPGKALDLDSWLGDYAAELEQLELDKWHLYEQRELLGPGWKIAFDGYLESYHLQVLHRKTFGVTTTANLMVVDAFGPHQRILYPAKSLRKLRDLPAEEWDPAQHCGTVYTIFPNVSIAGTWEGHGTVSQLFPGPTFDRSKTIQTIITRTPPVDDEDRQFTASFSELMERGIVDEDYRVGFSIQNGLSARANDHFVLGRNELALQHHHRWMKHLLGRQ